MALQPCRTAIQRSRTCARALTPCLRTYATDTTPSSNDAFNAAFANVRRDDYTSNLTVPKAAPQNAGKGPAPRWRQTPSGMQAELRMNFAKKEHNKIWKVNADPKKLDEMYDRFLGPNGSKLLPDELKWLAVTHKSFDQGRRGFNDRLALMGRVTLLMEATKHIVSQGPKSSVGQLPDEFERKPFKNSQLLAVDNLNVESAKDIVSKEALHSLAMSVGLLDVMRWKPRQTQKLHTSGVEVILNGGILAIVGALTLQHGSEVASKLVRERILKRLAEL